MTLESGDDVNCPKIGGPLDIIEKKDFVEDSFLDFVIDIFQVYCVHS